MDMIYATAAVINKHEQGATLTLLENGRVISSEDFASYDEARDWTELRFDSGELQLNDIFLWETLRTGERMALIRWPSLYPRLWISEPAWLEFRVGAPALNIGPVRAAEQLVEAHQAFTTAADAQQAGLSSVRSVTLDDVALALIGE